MNKVNKNKISLLGIISSPYNKQGIVIIKATTIGNKHIQQKLINWSKRILGKVALTHIKIKTSIMLFNPIEKQEYIPSEIGLMLIKKFLNIIKYPPINKIVIKIQISNILAYSPKKKDTKTDPACSVIKPLTNSDSASGKSKGALFVSAIHAIKNIINAGNKGQIVHTDFWLSTITDKLKLPQKSNTIRIIEVNISS